MADKRINALTTTSASVGDDYFAIDGATNGTRALSAFSPTFGGNATVTGTLSSAGNLSVTGTSAQVILGQASGSQLTYLIRPAQAGGAIQMVQDSATINRWLSLGGCDNTGAYSELMRVAGATGNILITSTVASTTTSTGALVVSGGVGVAGSIWAGVRLNVEYPTAANGSEHNVIKGIMGTDATLGALELNMGVLPSATAGSRYGYIACQDSLSNRGIYLGGRPGQGPGGATIYVPSTTASTTTSSGALVVSGGVGVAGAIYAGGLLSSSATTSLDGLPTAGIFGGTKRVALGYNTSGDYGFVACADSGTTWKELHLNPLGGLVKVPQSTASNDAYTGAFVVGGGVGAAGAVNAGTFFGLVDGVTAPATGSGYARIYVDSADGDLKVKFGDGTVKTIATDS